MEPFPSYKGHAYPRGPFQSSSGYGEPSMSGYFSQRSVDSPYGAKSYREGGSYLPPMPRQEAYYGPGGDSIARRPSLDEGMLGDPNYGLFDPDFPTQSDDYLPYSQAYGRGRSGAQIVYSSGPVRFPNRPGPEGGYGFRPMQLEPDVRAERSPMPVDLKRPRLPDFPRGRGGRRPSARHIPTYYCEICKVSCVGKMAYTDHQNGQRHKKRLAQTKAIDQLKSDKGDVVVQSSATTGTNKLRCELCDVVCTGADAYSAHLSGRQHKRTLRVHREMGKPIPSTDKPLAPTAVAGALSASTGATATGKPVAVAQNGTKPTEKPAAQAAELKPVDSKLPQTEPKPAVGLEYVEQVVGPGGRGLHYQCKLCDCQFTSADARDTHVKGRRHRLQYKKKVDPSLKVERKPSTGHGGRKSSQALKKPETTVPAPVTPVAPGPTPPSVATPKSHPEAMPLLGPPQPQFGRPFPGLSWPRYPASPQNSTVTVETRFMSVKHASLVPTELEAQAMKAVITICEHAFKTISDDLVAESARSEAKGSDAFDSDSDRDEKEEEEAGAAKTKTNQTPGATSNSGKNQPTEDRLLRGVVRVGALGKSLLLRNDHTGDLALVCSAWPTTQLMVYLNSELPDVLTRLDARFRYTINTDSKAGHITITAAKKSNGEAATNESAASSDAVPDWPTITVRVQVTSPAVHGTSGQPSPSSSGAVKAASGTRSSLDPSTASTATEQTRPSTTAAGNNNNIQGLSAPAVVPANRLSRAYQLIAHGEPICKNNCAQALEEINQAKWFQNALSKQPLGMVSRILLDFLRADADWCQLDEFATLSLLDRLLSMELQLGVRPPGGGRGPFPSPSGPFMRSGPQATGPSSAPVIPSRLFRRFFEAIASGLLLQLKSQAPIEEKDSQQAGAGSELFAFTVLAKTPMDVRERITASAQLVLRQIAFRQLWKVLRIEPTAAQYSYYRRRPAPAGEEESGKAAGDSELGAGDEECEDSAEPDVEEDDEISGAAAKRKRTEEDTPTESTKPVASAQPTTPNTSTPSGGVGTRASARLSGVGAKKF